MLQNQLYLLTYVLCNRLHSSNRLVVIVNHFFFWLTRDLIKLKLFSVSTVEFLLFRNCAES